MEKIVAGAGNQKLLFQFVTGEAQGRLRYQPCSECLIFFPPQLLLHGAGRREALGISLGLASRYSTKPRVTHSFNTDHFEQSQELFVRVRYFAYFVE